MNSCNCMSVTSFNLAQVPAYHLRQLFLPVFHALDKEVDVRVELGVVVGDIVHVGTEVRAVPNDGQRHRGDRLGAPVTGSSCQYSVRAARVN